MVFVDMMNIGSSKYTADFSEGKKGGEKKISETREATHKMGRALVKKKGKKGGKKKIDNTAKYKQQPGFFSLTSTSSHSFD